MSAVRRTVVVAPFLALIALSAIAQQPAPRTSETIDVSIVNVDVFVTDRNGKRVRGLTADDFEIRENGKVQPVSNFTEYSRAAENPAASPTDTRSARAAAADPQKRVIVLFVESTTLYPFRAKPFFDSLRRFVREAVRPGDSVALVSWMRTSVVRLEPTDDVKAIVTALDELEKEMTGGERNGGEELRRQEAIRAELEQELIDEGVPVDAAGLTAFMGIPEMLRELGYIRRKALALRSYMEDIAGFEGKKIMVMAMHRFGNYAGAEFFQGDVPVSMQGLANTRRERESVIETANAHNITLYPIYPRGIGTTHRANAEETRENIFAVDAAADLRTSAVDDRNHLNESASLAEIARATGGLSATGHANIGNLLPRIADDLDNYYSLGYRINATGRDVTRDIRVTVKNKDYEVRSRRQYVEMSDERRVRNLVTANVIEETPAGALPIEIVPNGAIKPKGKRRLVPITIRIPAEALTTHQNGGEFSVYLASGGGFGVVSDVEKRGQKFTLSAMKTALASKERYFTYDVTLEVHETSYRIAAGVLDEVSKEFGVARLTVPLGSPK